MNADEIARILDRANDLLEAGRPADTLRCLKQIERTLIEEGDRVEAAALRGWALSELGQHEHAVQAIDTLLEEYPDSSQLHAARGVVLSNADDLDEARLELEEAYALDPENETALANLAFVYEKMRDYEQALTLYEKAILMGVDIDWALQRKAAVETELGDYSAARRTLRRYLSLVPDDGAQWIALGILYSDDERYDDALASFHRAEKTVSDSAWLNLNWGVTAVRAGRLDEAEQRLALLRQVSGETARPALLEAFIAEERGDDPLAERSYSAALERSDPEDVEDFSYAHEMAIDFFARQGDTARCHALLEQAYRANACTVELCEAYREACGEYADEAVWFSMLVEADYRPGLVEIFDRAASLGEQPTRFLRNFQVIARDRDDAIAFVRNVAEEFGEQNIQIREFVSDEPIEDAHLGLYEVERRSFVFCAADEN